MINYLLLLCFARQDECDADTGSSELNPNVFKYQVFVCDNSSKDDQILHLLTADDVM